MVLIAAGCAVGCGDRLGTVPAGGVVTWSDKPVEGAQVMFLRDSQQGPAAIGVSDQDGRFELTTGESPGAVPGQYRVTVVKDNSAELGIPDPLPEGVTRTEYVRTHNLVLRPLLPVQYADFQQTPLRFEVSADTQKNDYAINLEGEPPQSPSHTPRPGTIMP